MILSDVFVFGHIFFEYFHKVYMFVYISYISIKYAYAQHARVKYTISNGSFNNTIHTNTVLNNV